MAARSGLFVDPVPGSPPVGTAMADARRAIAPLTGATFRALTGGTLTTSASNMQITVAQSVWVIPDPTDAASAFWAPTDATVLAPAAGPTTGSRIDLIVVKQNNVSNGDTDSRVSVTLVAGTASASPVAPATPAGAQIVAQITVPTNAATSSACTVAPKVPLLLNARPPMYVATYAALQTYTGATGDIVTVTSDSNIWLNGVYRWTSAGQWMLIGGDLGWQTFGTAAAAAAAGFGPQSGYTVNQVVVRAAGPVISLNLNLTKASASLAGGSDGNVANADVIGLPNALTPSVSNGQYGAAASGAMKSLYASSGGTIRLAAIAPSSTIAVGDTVDISGMHLL